MHKLSNLEVTINFYLTFTDPKVAGPSVDNCISFYFVSNLAEGKFMKVWQYWGKAEQK